MLVPLWEKHGQWKRESMQMQPGIHTLVSHAFPENIHRFAHARKKRPRRPRVCGGYFSETCNYSMNERKHVYGLTQENGRDARWPENTKKRVTFHMNWESYSIVVCYKLSCKLIIIFIAFSIMNKNNIISRL